MTSAELAARSADFQPVPYGDALALDVSAVDADLGRLTRAIYVGGAGNLTVLMANGKKVLFQTVPAGTTLPLAVAKVFTSGTVATKIVALF